MTGSHCVAAALISCSPFVVSKCCRNAVNREYTNDIRRNLSRAESAYILNPVKCKVKLEISEVAHLYGRRRIDKQDVLIPVD